ncbi:shikimate kinase [Allopontixanthobacter sp.]|uniref:shikimate kinase n=1 Tax=Allopontixanthobacter sp. TaxID=2906452 RepID=UPI002ABC13D6|nr:shikimate kinase [Allopontixanthobacter sp.]MDZ4308699.1 shikimate kinase [Allopontixanthobacter sp.]
MDDQPSAPPGRGRHPDAAAARAIAARIGRPIVLVGLMGAGKTTVGRRLASLLRTEFVDADDAIEDAAQLSIAEIFEQFGEEYFRDGERRVIARLIEDSARNKGGVIATGGGAFCNSETRALILAEAVAVWIDCDIDTLVERTGRRNVRPLLRGGDPHEILSRLHRERREFYAQAPIRINSRTGPHQDTALAIIEAIDKWL